MFPDMFLQDGRERWHGGPGSCWQRGHLAGPLLCPHTPSLSGDGDRAGQDVPREPLTVGGGWGAPGRRWHSGSRCGCWRGPCKVSGGAIRAGDASLSPLVSPGPAPGGPRGGTGTYSRFSSGRPRKAPGWTVLIRLFFRSLRGDRHGSWGALWEPHPQETQHRGHEHSRATPGPPSAANPCSLTVPHRISLSLSLRGDASPWAHSGCPAEHRVALHAGTGCWHRPRAAPGPAVSRRVISCVRDKNTAPDGLCGPREARLSNYPDFGCASNRAGPAHPARVSAQPLGPAATSAEHRRCPGEEMGSIWIRVYL